MDYAISPNTAAIMNRLTALPAVEAGLRFLEADHPNTVRDQLELVVVKAPTFHEHERAADMARRFEALGLEAVHIDGLCNVIGLKRGTGTGPAILMEAHLDTVFPFEVEIVPEIRDGKIFAPGICDCTRGLAAMLSVIRAMNETEVKHSGDIYFVGTAREEGMGGLGGMKGFFESHRDKIAASITIDGGGADRIVHNATGIKTVVFTFAGAGGHAYGAFGKVANCLHAAARAVAKIAELQVPADPRTTFAVSNFHSGNDAGIHAIPQSAGFKINFRSNSPEALGTLKADIFRCVSEACTEETARWGVEEMTFTHEYLVDVPAGSQDIHLPILEAAYSAMQHLGLTPQFSKDGSTNANIPVGLGVPAVCIGRGGPEGGVHTTDEWCMVDGTYPCPQEAFLIALALSGVAGETESVMGQGAAAVSSPLSF